MFLVIMDENWTWGADLDLARGFFWNPKWPTTGQDTPFTDMMLTTGLRVGYTLDWYESYKRFLPLPCAAARYSC